jgi:predicted signal transduction protein with EAL and GGDEF domain
MLRGTNTLVATEVAQRMVQAVAAPVKLGTHVAVVGVSVGIAAATADTDFEQLIHRADVAMYAAKAKGKARVQVFEAGLLEGNSTEAVFERQLAAASVNGELVVHYQPVLSLPGGRCMAVEALVRWQHPEHGLLYPDRFIDVAERTGAIHDIGAAVLQRACADVAVWRTSHPGVPLAVHVNVSALQLDDQGFFDAVTTCLEEFALPPEALVLEVTETVVIASPAANLRAQHSRSPWRHDRHRRLRHRLLRADDAAFAAGADRED